MTSYTIYAIMNTTNQKCYIGQSNDANRRKINHFSLLKHNKHTNNHLQRAYNKYGHDSFAWEILEFDISTQDLANDRECYWLDQYPDNYNLQAGGNDVSDYFRTPCIWEGVEYRSLIEAARDTGLTLMQMQWRFRRGYTQESDLVGITKECEWNGIVYPSIRDAAKAHNVAETTIADRLKKGYKCDSDMQRQHKRPYVWNGITYPSLKAVARMLGVSKTTMRGYVKKGYTSDNDIP